MIATLRTMNGELLETVVKRLSEELHMQHHPEREQLMISILDSSKEDMERICAGLADTLIELYMKCDKGKEKYGRFQVEWHQSCSKFLLDRNKSGDVDNCGHDLSLLSLPILWLLLTKRPILAVTAKPVVTAYQEYTQGYSQPSNEFHDTTSNTCSKGVRQSK